MNKLHLLGAVCAILSLTASAYTAAPIGGGRWLIQCNDKTIFTYSGGEDGVGTAGSALCEGHDGATAPGITGMKKQGQQAPLEPVGASHVVPKVTQPRDKDSIVITDESTK